jgi:hypothetical protein
VASGVTPWRRDSRLGQCVTSAETGFGITRAGIQFRSLSEGDQTVFWPSPRDGSAVEGALRDAEVPAGERAAALNQCSGMTPETL